MSRPSITPVGISLVLGLSGILLVGCQEQPSSELLTPQFAKAKPAQTLTITGGGTGGGTVTAPAYGESGTLHCAISAGTSNPLECSRTYGWKTTVQLTAAAQPGSAFSGWTGACTGSAPTCKVVITQSRDVRASFSGSSTPSFALNILGAGTGSGTVTSQAGLSPAITCTITSGGASSNGCSATYLQGTVVALTASAATDNSFTGWGGDCSGSSCTVTMGANHAVSASFSVPLGPEATVGRWDPPLPTPIVGMHLVQLPNGKTLMWGHTGEPQLWNGPGAGFLQVTNNTCTNPTLCELFCSGHAFLADGRLLVAGGHDEELGNLNGLTQASIFDGVSWQATASMHDRRWYPTLVTLATGDVLAISGTIAPDLLSTIPERYSANTSSWSRLTGIVAWIPPYAPAFVEPKAGNVFVTSGPVHELNPNGTGSWITGAVPLEADRGTGPAVMLDSKVLVIGGGGEEPCPANLPKQTTEIIDLAAASPTWTSSGSMQIGRRMANATILPDGSVLVTGGTSLCGFSNESGAVFAAELWDPATGQFSKLANASVMRLYHSTTMLLEDGRVMSTAGGDGGGVTSQLSYEIFSPPYLFKGPRPAANLVRNDMHYGQSFTVNSVNAASIRKVTIIRLAATTHTFDMGQRLNTLAFQVSADGQSLTVTAPAAGQIAPPGPYRIFLLNDLGVPSVGQNILVTP